MILATLLCLGSLAVYPIFDGEESVNARREALAGDMEVRQHILDYNAGEYGHITSGAVDYGAWWNDSFTRLGGLTMTDKDRWEIGDKIRSEPGKIRLSSMKDRRDRALLRPVKMPESGSL